MHRANIEDQSNEEQLVLNAKQDLRNFDALYLRYAQPVYRYLYSRIGSGAEAEDAAAQTFLSALEGFGRYRHEGHFGAWLFGIARRKAADHFRINSKHMTLADTLLDDEADVPQIAERNQRIHELMQVIKALPEEEQELIRLRYAAELGFAEIARLLNRKEDAVKKTLYRLLDRLQSRLEGHND